VINVRPVGVLIMEDNAGQDEKVIAVPAHALTKRYDHVQDHTDLPDITMQQVEHFFEHYKDLEPGKWVRIGDWYGAEKAKELIVEAIDREDRRNQRAS
jgi:inorganic pyrophosphatase